MSPHLQYLLEAQAVKERLLSRADYSLGDLVDVPPFYGRAPSRHAVLPYLALYPEVRATRSEFVLDRLSTAGLSVTIEEPALVRYINYVTDWSDGSEDVEFVRLLSRAHREARQLCLHNQRSLLELLTGLIGADHLDSDCVSRSDNAITEACSNLFALYLPQTLLRLERFYRYGLTGSILQDAEFRDAVCPELDEAGLVSHPYFEALLGRLDDFYTRMVAELFISSHDGTQFGTKPWFRRLDPAPVITSASEVRPAVQVLQIRFNEEIRILPAPRSLTEAAEMSQSRQVKRLRRKIEQWLQEVGPDQQQLEKKIRSDIALAARDLRQLRTIREYKESPVVFGIKAVAGCIPIVANVVTVAETLGWGYERWLDRRSSWIAIDNS